MLQQNTVQRALVARRLAFGGASPELVEIELLCSLFVCRVNHGFRSETPHGSLLLRLFQSHDEMLKGGDSEQLEDLGKRLFSAGEFGRNGLDNINVRAFNKHAAMEDSADAEDAMSGGLRLETLVSACLNA